MANVQAKQLRDLLSWSVRNTNDFNQHNQWFAGALRDWSTEQLGSQRNMLGNLNNILQGTINAGGMTPEIDALAKRYGSIADSGGMTDSLSFINNALKGRVEGGGMTPELKFITDHLQSQLNNPQGFDPTTLASMRASASDNVASQYRNASQTLNSRLASQSNNGLPSGVAAQLQGDLAGQAAGQTAGAYNDINIKNGQLQNQNYWNAITGLGNASNAQNANYNSAIGGLNTSAGLQNQLLMNSLSGLGNTAQMQLGNYWNAAQGMQGVAGLDQNLLQSLLGGGVQYGNLSNSLANTEGTLGMDSLQADQVYQKSKGPGIGGILGGIGGSLLGMGLNAIAPGVGSLVQGGMGALMGGLGIGRPSTMSVASAGGGEFQSPAWGNIFNSLGSLGASSDGWKPPTPGISFASPAATGSDNWIPPTPGISFAR